MRGLTQQASKQLDQGINVFLRPDHNNCPINSNIVQLRSLGAIVTYDRTLWIWVNIGDVAEPENACKQIDMKRRIEPMQYLMQDQHTRDENKPIM